MKVSYIYADAKNFVNILCIIISYKKKIKIPQIYSNQKFMKRIF